jgi:hypothetical protein
LKTLLTGAGTAITHRLKTTIPLNELILGDYKDVPELMFNTRSVVRLPDPKNASYAHEMLTLCLDLEVTAFYVLRAEEVTPIKEAEQLFNEFGIAVTIANEVR